MHLASDHPERSTERAPTAERILDAAERLVTRIGYTHLGIEQIISDADVSKSTFYNHFESKDHVLVEMLLAHRPRIDELPETLADRAGDDPIEQLVAYFDLLNESGNDDEEGIDPSTAALSAFREQSDPVRIAALQIQRDARRIMRGIMEQALGPDCDERFERYWLIVAGHASGNPWVETVRSKNCAMMAIESTADA